MGPLRLLISLVALLLWPAGIAVAQATPLPVDYSPVPGYAAEIAHPGGSLPGSNDWTCRPSAAHPNPVVLVHGTLGGQQTNWGVLAPVLANEGYCVYALTYGANAALPWPASAVGGLAPVEQSSAELAAFVDRVLTATGAHKVDLVGHSQGTFMPTYYAKFLGGANKIDKYVSLAPLWHGSELIPPELARANDKVIEGGAYLPNITYTNIMTRYDELVVPYTSGYLAGPNATNIVVQDGCEQDHTGHAGLAYTRRAAGFVLNALDPAHPRPVPCDFIPPFGG